MMKSQIKMQILKLAKSLNRFSIDDILTMLDACGQEIQKNLSELENESVIKKIGETQYLYVKLKTNKEFKKSKNAKIAIKKINFEVKKLKEITPFKVFNKNEELKLYESAPDWAKRRATKYISLIKLVGRLKGKQLDKFLKKIGKKYPELKTTYPTFKQNQAKYMKQGLRAFIPINGKRNKYSIVDEDMYRYFKEVYLNTDGLSMHKCVELVKENKQFKNAIIPGYLAFKRLLYKEYNQEEIEKMRYREIDLPEIPDTKIKLTHALDFQKQLNLSFEKYTDAVEYYLESKEFKKQKEKLKSIERGFLKNHLSPFFAELKIDKITQEKVDEFYKLKLKEGLSTDSISRIFTLLRKILCLTKKQKIIVEENNPTSKKTLSNKELKLILHSKTKIKLLLMFALSLGLKQNEILALDYSDIDFNFRTIKVNKIFYKNKIEKYRCSKHKRKLFIPEILFTQLPKVEKGRIFNIQTENVDLKIFRLGKSLKIKDLTYDCFVNTYVKVLIDNKIPINIIANILAFSNIQKFCEKYSAFIPQSIDINFDPLSIVN